MGPAGGAGRAPAAHLRTAVPAVSRAVQCANFGHVFSKFETEYGSKYTVDEGGLTREKYYGETSVNPQKSIFYGDESTTGKCMRAYDDCASYKVTQAGFGTVTITFYDRYHQAIYSGKLQEWPQSGLYPVDMILKENGTGAKSDRFHVGDRIV